MVISLNANLGNVVVTPTALIKIVSRLAILGLIVWFAGRGAGSFVAEKANEQIFADQVAVAAASAKVRAAEHSQIAAESALQKQAIHDRATERRAKVELIVEIAADLEAQTTLSKQAIREFAILQFRKIAPNLDELLATSHRATDQADHEGDGQRQEADRAAREATAPRQGTDRRVRDLFPPSR